MSRRNQIAFALTLISFVILYLGLTLPALTITLSSKIVTQMGNLEGEVFNKTRSIMGTIRDLFAEDRNLVAGLILLFSVIVPVGKGVLLLIALLIKARPIAGRMVNFVRRIGKWSMAYIRADEIDGEILARIRGTDTFDPFDIAPGEAMDFLKQVVRESEDLLTQQQAVTGN